LCAGTRMAWTLGMLREGKAAGDNDLKVVGPLRRFASDNERQRFRRGSDAEIALHRDRASSRRHPFAHRGACHSVLQHGLPAFEVHRDEPTDIGGERSAPGFFKRWLRGAWVSQSDLITCLPARVDPVGQPDLAIGFRSLDWPPMVLIPFVI
jgi:hypothetical protein